MSLETIKPSLPPFTDPVNSVRKQQENHQKRTLRLGNNNNHDNKESKGTPNRQSNSNKQKRNRNSQTKSNDSIEPKEFSPTVTNRKSLTPKSAPTRKYSNLSPSSPTNAKSERLQNDESLDMQPTIRRISPALTNFTPERRATINEAVRNRGSVSIPLNVLDSTSFAYARRSSAPPILPTASSVPVTYNGLPYMLVPAQSQLPVQVTTPIGYYYPPTSVGRASTDSNSTPSRMCKFFLQGSCKFGDRCTFNHVPTPTVPILTPIPVVVPQPPPVTVDNYEGMNLSREDCLVVLRLLVHLEEIQVQNPTAIVVQFEQQTTENGEVKTTLTSLTATDIFAHLNAGYANQSPSLLISLNELLGNEVILSMSECATQIVSVLPSATLDLDTIINTTKVCDNDALLFFAMLLRDIQEHFYVPEFNDKYLHKGKDSYTYNTEHVYKILQQIGIKEEEIYSKLDYDQTKKISQCFKRWRFLYLSLNPDTIILESEVPDPVKTKAEILKRLEDHVLYHIGKLPGQRKSRRSKSSASKIPSFSVLFGIEPVGQNIRRKNWNEFRSNRNPEEICKELNTTIGELKTQGFTNFPAIFNLISSKLKIVQNEKNGPKNLDEKLSSIGDVLRKWPEVLLLPEILQRNDGKLRVYYSISQEHQLGAVYEELMTRLKKKYLYKSSLRELIEKTI